MSIMRNVPSTVVVISNIRLSDIIIQMKLNRSTFIIVLIGVSILLAMISIDIAFRYVGEIYENFASNPNRQ